MIIDSRSLEAGDEIRADICIIGAGAAGLAMARQLSAGGLSVCLLEAGGFDFDSDIQDVYEGEHLSVNRGQSISPCRLRYLGGTTNHWNGQCRPLDAQDFAKRDWVPFSGWPLEHAALQPYYDQAVETIQLGSPNFDPDYWQREGASDWYRLPQLDSGLMYPAVYQYSPLRFGEVYRAEIEASDNVRLLHHANLLTIDTNDSAGEVTGLTVQAWEAERFSVHANTYVLATGGIENARRLLLSDQVMSNGLGNANDQVGRYFAQHTHASIAEILPESPLLPLGLLDFWSIGDSRGRHHLVFTPEVEEKQQMLRGGMALEIEFAAGKPGYGERLSRFFGSDDLPWSDSQSDNRGLIEDLGRIGGNMRDAWKGRFRPVKRIEVEFSMEQAPNPDSRVLLTGDRDTLGQRRAAVDWRMTDLDEYSMQQAHELTARVVGAAGMGRLQMEGARSAEWSFIHRDMDGGCHHIGTTRMSDDPKTGVVDSDCRVHGMANLYVAGSSVFPTGGYANPTLTIVALAHRLADHLAARQPV